MSFPWYFLEESRGQHHLFWCALKRELERLGLRDLPGELDNEHRGRQLWENADLLLTQCCGCDLIGGSADVLQYVATPVYDIPECEGHMYSSLVVVSNRHAARTLDQIQGMRLAINELDSYSGYHCIWRVPQLVPVLTAHPRGHILTGAHRLSLQAIVDDHADIAVIDSVTFTALTRFRPHLTDAVHVVGQLQLAPAPPFVTSQATSVETVAQLRVALANVTRDAQAANWQDALMLAGTVVHDPAEYLVMNTCIERSRNLLRSHDAS